jgi:predicted DNA repair protein MutK
MASGLLALLDDVAGIAKLAASSLDDVGAAAGKASSKAAGVVIDDAAVTPGYIIGFTPDRELPIIAKIAKGSLINKLIFLLPLALLLSAFAPWALTPLLMIGGTYLAFEGTEKLVESVLPHAHHEHPVEPDLGGTVEQIEDEKVRGAIRTDFILSGEIMAISLASVAARPIWEQAVALVIVAILITAGVYGAVGFIVKMDDIGLHMAGRRRRGTRLIGRGLVRGMPIVMEALSAIGSFAMLWVGGGILLHGLEHYGFKAVPDFIHDLAHRVAELAGTLGPVLAWAIDAVAAAIVAVIVGLVVVILHTGFVRIRQRIRPS